MGCTKNYLLTLLQLCSEEKFGQDAIEYALVAGALRPTYDLETDLRAIMGEPGKPETGRYDEFVVAYQRQCREHGDALVDLYHASGLMEEILRPIPLSLAHDTKN
jgi:hypothetical protein